MKEVEGKIVDTSSTDNTPISESASAITQDANNELGKDTADSSKVESTSNSGKTPTKVDKSFTQEELNQIVLDRLDKVYKKYNVANSNELDTLVGKAQSYDETNEKLEDTIKELTNVKTENAMIKTNIAPKNYDVVKSYMNSKGIDITEENITKLLDTFPEWKDVPNATPTVQYNSLGNSENGKTELSERDKMIKIFGGL